MNKKDPIDNTKFPVKLNLRDLEFEINLSESKKYYFITIKCNGSEQIIFLKRKK